MVGWDSQPGDQRDRCDCCGGFLGPEHDAAKARREEVHEALVKALRKWVASYERGGTGILLDDLVEESQAALPAEE